MREKVIEQKLVAEVKKRGGICPKWVSPGFDGMQGEYFNGYSIQCLAKHFDRIHNKLPVEPMTLEKKTSSLTNGGRRYLLMRVNSQH